MKLLYLFSILVLVSCKNKNDQHKSYESETLKIAQLTPGTWVHISYLTLPEYGKVACNGMIMMDDSEAVVFDTPTNDDVSTELIEWIENELDANVKAVVITHFHEDCLGGLKEFHKRKIPSYANNLTIEFAREDSLELPQNGFDGSFEMMIGEKKVVNRFFGEGHTSCNIVGYVPDDNVLFGGCLIKAVDASKGNLNDANVNEWSETVRNIKSTYPDLKYVIPGHGEVGGVELLDYTSALFENQQ